jgi:uncharacterized protein
VKAVIDTNVVLSGFFFGGVPGQVLEGWRDGAFVAVLSADIIAEYREAAMELEAKFGPTSFETFVALLLVNSEVMDAPSLPEQVCSDPHDDKFLACAIASGTQVIVSGDKALLAATGWSAIAVVTPLHFSNGTSRPQHNASEFTCAPLQARVRQVEPTPHHGARTSIRICVSGAIPR